MPRKTLGSGPLLWPILTLGGGLAVGGAIATFIAPVVSRLYSPADFGHVGVVSSFASVASVALSMKYEVAIVSAKNSQDAGRLALLSVLAALPSSVLAWGVLTVLVNRSLLGYEALAGTTAVPLGCAIALMMSLQLVGRYWMIRNGRFQEVAAAIVAQNALRAATQVGFGVIGLGWGGLLWGELIGRSAAAAFYARAAWRAVREDLVGTTWAGLVSVARAHYRFPAFALPSSLVDALALSLPIPVFLRLFGAEAGGHLAFVQMVLAVPLALIGGSTADAFHNRLAECVRVNPPGASRLFLRATAGLLAVGVLIAGVIAIAGVYGFRLFFGTKWETSGVLAAVMTPWFLGQLTVGPLSRVVFVFQALRAKLVRDVTALTVVVAVPWLSHRAGSGLVRSVQLLSAAQMLIYAGYWGLLWWITRRWTRAGD